MNTREPDWNALVALADLRGVPLAESVPRWVPPGAFDLRRAWIGQVNGEPVRLEAAAYGGRIVFAKRGGPWNDPEAGESAARGPAGDGAVAGLADAVMPVLWLGVAISVVLLARRHVRLGRGDRHGAIRVATFVLGVGAVADLAARHWVFSAESIWAGVSRYQGRALFSAALVWLCYLGLEPFVRRSAPHLLIGWTRLLGGQWRDPLVGQGLLAGALLGTLWPVVATLPPLAGPLLGLEGAHLRLHAGTLAPAPMYLAAIAWSALNGVINALALVAFMVTSRLVLRNGAVVAVLTAAAATLASIMGVQPAALDLAQAAISGVAAVWFMRRFGLLALATALAINWAVRATPWTLDPSVWFAWRAGLTAVLILGVATWGFLNVLGRQSPFPSMNLDA
jgi:serine/threonine-protein kinase